MNSKRSLVLFHIIGCITFLLLPVLFFPSSSKSFNVFTSPPSQRDFLGQILLVAFFYFNYFFLIPKFYFMRRYVIFFSITILCFVLIILLPYLLLHPFQSYQPPPPYTMQPPQPFQRDLNAPPPPQGPERRGPFIGEVSHHIFLFFVCFFFSLNLRIASRLKQTQQEKLDAELSYLKAQINPHFLFNTLNSIYSLAIQKSDAAPDAIIRLSDMMRYVLHDSGSNFVALNKEIAYIKNYIQLQEIRFSNNMVLKLDITGDTENKMIAPLILIPFIENAFKYGVNAEEDARIKIEINILANSLIMQVHNNKVNQSKLTEEQSGVGIRNTKERLVLLYPARHELAITNNENDFFVFLKLQLT